MSIFGDILRKIFPADHPAVTAQPDATASAAGAAPKTSTAEPAQAPVPRPMDPVDVADVLTALATVNPGPANWKTSIVDLMKLLGLSSDLAARKQLASELGYTGDTSDTATMNVWLHKQVMAKLAANGGIVPPDLKH